MHGPKNSAAKHVKEKKNRKENQKNPRLDMEIPTTLPQ